MALIVSILNMANPYLSGIIVDRVIIGGQRNLPAIIL